MKKITGFGGVFTKARVPVKTLANWYQQRRAMVDVYNNGYLDLPYTDAP